jgi:hypothetical protein
VWRRLGGDKEFLGDFRVEECCTVNAHFVVGDQFSGIMVKLVSVRKTRLYGPGSWRDWWEYVNAFVYFVATIVLLGGCIMLLPGRSTKLGLILALVALALFVIVNLHDLIAQLAGFDFRLSLLWLDPQLALIEILAPLVQVIGSILFFMGTFSLLEVSAVLSWNYRVEQFQETESLLLLGLVIHAQLFSNVARFVKNNTRLVIKQAICYKIRKMAAGLLGFFNCNCHAFLLQLLTCERSVVGHIAFMGHMCAGGTWKVR